MHFNVNDALYSQFSHQHISAAIMAIFMVILLQEYECTVQLVVSSSLHKNKKLSLFRLNVCKCYKYRLKMGND
jgi:hypothetical protein